MINLSEVKPNKVSTDPRSYNLLLAGPSKIGKSTFINKLYGKDVLQIFTEKRFASLEDAMVVYAPKWADLKSVINQLKRNDIKERFKHISIDTIDNAYQAAEEYVSNHFNEKMVGEGEVGYGKDYTMLQHEWNWFISSLESLSYSTIYVTHTTNTTVQVKPYDISVEDGHKLVGAQKVKDNAGEEFIEFTKLVPDIKPKALAPISKAVDNIFLIDTLPDENGNPKRVMYLRGDMQHVAGSTFKNIPSIIDFDVDVYKNTIENALENYENTTDELVRHADIKGTEYDFKSLKEEATELAQRFYTADLMEEVTKITDAELGTNIKVSSLSEKQVEELAVVVSAMKDKAEELGI